MLGTLVILLLTLGAYLLVRYVQARLARERQLSDRKTAAKKASQRRDMDEALRSRPARPQVEE